MNRSPSSLACLAVLAALLVPASAYAQTTTDHTTCRAGTLSVLAQDEKKIVLFLDHRGVAQGASAQDPFHGSTQRCVGTIANFDGKVTSGGWCKQVHPQTGDWLVLDWAGSGTPGAGTYTLRHGTGKWKGITGSGTYEAVGQTRPVEAGTYQNCVRIKGTLNIPG
jgi:hypothetical protein